MTAKKSKKKTRSAGRLPGELASGQIRVSLYLDRETAIELRKYCHEHYMQQVPVIRAALRKYLGLPPEE